MAFQDWMVLLDLGLDGSSVLDIGRAFAWTLDFKTAL
jgi:hypothetical protein